MSNQSKPYDNLYVKYYDYLGYEHGGTIVLVQPCPTAEVEGETYIYILDEMPEYNDKVYKAPDGTEYKYAEIRRSTEVWRPVDA